MTNQQKKNIHTWIKALRSGDYKQIQRALFGLTEEGERGYCCLGVARCIFKDTPYRVYEAKEFSDNEGLLTSGSFEKTFGLNPDVQQTLANLNDNGASFTEIAEFLEEFLA